MPALLFLLLISIAASVSAGVIECTGKTGRIIFTDQIQRCTDQPQQRQLSQQNLMSSQHIEIDVNYRIHRRQYAQIERSGWRIFYESSMQTGAPVLLEQSLKKLSDNLIAVSLLLPASAIVDLKSVDFYLLWGADSPQGGKRSGLRYLRRNEAQHKENIDPRWSESVVIFSANNFMYLKPHWTKHVLVHELAHAWHIQHRWLYDKDIQRVAEHAEKNKLYHLLQDENGNYIPKAYAMKNHLEYFAEMSSIYFTQANYFPFNRAGLKVHDPQAFALMQTVWPAQ